MSAAPNVAWMFPGQGSQAVGMGKALFEASPAAREVFVRADDALSMPLSKLCFEGPEAELVLTANTQPAILTCSVAALMALRERTELAAPAMALGHSLGEWSALVAVGALDFAEALRCVRLRGEAMQRAVPPGTGAMAAIIGLDPEAVEVLCAEASRAGPAREQVAPANENGGGQIVIAGHQGAVDRAMASAKARGGKALALKVSAPFHCELMAPAAAAVADALASVAVRPMIAPVIANVDAAANDDPALVVDRLVRQVTGRVRWEASVRTAIRMGATHALEFGHGRVLAQLVKRIDASLAVKGVGSPGDIDVISSEALR